MTDTTRTVQLFVQAVRDVEISTRAQLGAGA